MITNLPSAPALFTDPIQSLGLGDAGSIIAAFVFVMSCEEERSSAIPLF